MKTYQACIMVIALTSVIGPNLARALDAEGEVLAESIKTVYFQTISASHLTPVGKQIGDLKTYKPWAVFIEDYVVPYVTENGDQDRILMDSLDVLTKVSNDFTIHLQHVWERTITMKGMLGTYLTKISEGGGLVNKTISALRKEKYAASASKQNARTILLLALCRVEDTTNEAIALLVEEQNRR